MQFFAEQFSFNVRVTYEEEEEEEEEDFA